MFSSWVRRIVREEIDASIGSVIDAQLACLKDEHDAMLKVVDSVIHQDDPDADKNLDRELRVAALRAQGLSFRKIGEELNISRQRAQQIYQRSKDRKV